MYRFLSNNYNSLFSLTISFIRPKVFTNLYINVRFEHDIAKKTARTINVAEADNGKGIRDSLFAKVQCEPDKKQKKVSIIGGGGRVGQIVAYHLINKKLCDEIVLWDVPKPGTVFGVAFDTLGGVSFNNHPNIRVCTDGNLTKDSDLLIICSGKGVVKGQSRLEALQDNINIFKTLIPQITSFSPNCVMLVLSNPVDLMAYAAFKYSGFPCHRVVGLGTEVDTSRFKFFLSRRLGISTKSINAWIIGEHGLSCVPCWSSINVAGTRLRDIKPDFGYECDPECWCDLEENTKQMANVIKGFKGFTCYSIALCASSVVEAILTNARTVHAVSTCCNGIHDINIQSFISLPAVIGNTGVTHIIKQVLDCKEKIQLSNSCRVLERACNTIKW